MSESVIIDEIHLTVRVPADLTPTQSAAILRTLTGVAFMGRLRRAIRAVVTAFPELTFGRVTLTR